MAGSQSNENKKRQYIAKPDKTRVKITLNHPQSSGITKPGKKYSKYFSNKYKQGSAVKRFRFVKGKDGHKRIKVIGRVSAPEKPVDAPILPEPFEQ